MDKITTESSQGRYLDDFARLTEVIIKYVQEEHLLPYKMPDWDWPEDQALPLGRVGQWMHWLYGPRGFLVNLLPSRAWLMLVVVLSVGLEVTYPGLLTELLTLRQTVLRAPMSTLQFSWRVIGAGLLLSVLVLLEVLVPLASAIGVYWSFFEIAVNRNINWFLKIFTVAVVLGLVGLWLADGAILLSEYMEYDEYGVQLGADRIREAVAYRLLSSILFYIPGITYGALFGTKVILFAVQTVRSALYWTISFHVPRRANVAAEFLRGHLPIDEAETVTVLELDLRQIEALHDWATCRRQIVYDRLLPTTILLASLGIVANTSLGEEAVKEALTILREYSQMGDPATWWLAYLRFILLVVIVVFPAVVIFMLLNEAFAMDFIAQATVLARHAILAEEDTRGENPASSSNPRPHLCRLLDVLRKTILGNRKHE